MDLAKYKECSIISLVETHLNINIENNELINDLTIKADIEKAKIAREQKERKPMEL